MKRTFSVLLLFAIVCPGLHGQSDSKSKPLPDAPSFARPKWVVPVAGDAALSLWDASSSLTHHGGCVESNPLLGSQPSAGRFFGQLLGTSAAIDLLAWKLHRRHPRWAYALLAYDGGSHAYGIATNYANCSSASDPTWSHIPRPPVRPRR